MIYGVVGLGIMGGSIAKAIRSNIITGENPTDTNGKIFALDKNEDSLSQALSSGTIDSTFTPSESKKMLSQVDVLFVCLYPKATLEFFKQHKNDYKNGAIITDISGVKHELSINIEEIRPSNAHLILGHPMAG